MSLVEKGDHTINQNLRNKQQDRAFEGHVAVKGADDKATGSSSMKMETAFTF